MAIPVSGPLSFNTLNTELGLASGSTISINDVGVRDLTGNASGQTSLSAVYGVTYPLAFYPSSTTSINMVARRNTANTYTYLELQLNTTGTLGWNASYSSGTISIPTGYHSPSVAAAIERYQYRFLQNTWTNTGGIGSWVFGQIAAAGAQLSAYSPSSGTIDTGWVTPGAGALYQRWSYWQSSVNVALGADATMAGTLQMRRIGATSITRSIPFSFRIYFAA
jgi:hypothetical protein